MQKVTLSRKWAGNEAIAYLPDKKIADGAIVFSHSAIHADNGASVDLLVFALTLARAGAAVIVRKRTLTWMPQNRSTNREGAPVCAGRWLVDHARVFNNGKPTVSEENIVVREGYGYVGPRLCDPAVAADCKLINENEGFCRPRHCHGVWVPVGETEGSDSTDNILSDGGLRSAQWLQRELGLAQIGALASPKSGSGT